MPTDLKALWDAPETAGFWPAGVQRVILDEADSTMAEARRRADEFSGPTWIMAHQQSAGHGRRGRPWHMPKGNFAATLIFRPDSSPANAALRSFIASLALYQTLAMTAPADRISLKWPNDVLLDGAKVAGILLESEGRGARVDWLAVGIGVNLAASPGVDTLEAGAIPPISLVEATGKTVSPEDFLFWLASHFADLEQQFQEQGFEPLRQLWLRHAARVGQQITARTARESLTGTFETIDDAGQLVLLTPKGQVAISAGDVFF